MKEKPIRVGFDLDGVLLYNPARIARMPISLIKKLLPRKAKSSQKTFHIPTSEIEKKIWWSFHLTSMFAAPGLDTIQDLVQRKKIVAYVVSARYDFLKPDFDKWMRRINKNEIFTDTYMNENNEQPHQFKERMINDLHLDMFVEDNWDIVHHLSSHTKSKVFWVYNILDTFITYDNKFPTLKKAVFHIKKQLDTQIEKK